jgi:serine/threonine-protein kinase RsbW
MEAKTICLSGNFKSLEKVSQFVEEYARRVGFDDNTLYGIETAVDEAFSNIIEHAYGKENAGDIECTCRANQDCLTVVLHDHGYPFDPNAIPDPILDCCLENRQGRGLGLFYMKKYMDEVHFDFSQEQGNTLTMIKFKIKGTSS